MHLVLTAALWGCATLLDADFDADSDDDGMLDAEEGAFGMVVGDPDTDDDGLTDGAELDAGTHPLIADIDADRLTDRQEISEIGTDPWLTDTDGDGYADGDEVAEGSDPLERRDVIYAGGWPYQHDKDAFGGPALEDAENAPGQPFARLKLLDQYGEEVDLYDFAGHGKPVVVVIATPWCGGSLALAEYVSGADDPYGYGSYWPNLKRLVDDGKISWITVITDTASGEEPTLADAEEWSESAPHPLVPYLVGSSAIDAVYVNYSWPSVYFLDEDLRIVDGPDGTNDGFYDGLDAADACGP